MKKDSIFWLCMAINMLALILLVVLKPQVHLLPAIAMYIIIKINFILQIGVGMYALWVSTDSKLFFLFIKVYAAFILFYALTKMPVLSFLADVKAINEGLFSPFPFVLGWIVNQAFYQKETKEV